MASGVPPSYDASSAPPPGAPGHSGQQQYPPSTAPYPQQSSTPYPTSAPPAYPMKDGAPQGPSPGYPAQGPSPGYPAQGPPPGYPAQGPPPGYPAQGAPPGYPYAGYQPHGAAAGYTTQGVPVHYNQATSQTTIITQQPGGITMVAQVPPHDHFALSIVSMFCCFFIGIFALMNSIKSRERFRMGDYAGATQFGMSARRLATIAIVTAICVYVTIVILRIILQAAFTGQQ